MVSRMHKGKILPKSGLQVWLITSRQTEPDLNCNQPQQIPLGQYHAQPLNGLLLSLTCRPRSGGKCG